MIKKRLIWVFLVSIVIYLGTLIALAMIQPLFLQKDLCQKQVPIHQRTDLPPEPETGVNMSKLFTWPTVPVGAIWFLVCFLL